MKTAVLMLGLLLAAPALAQTAPDPAPMPADTATAPAPRPVSALMQLRMDCRATARGQGLKGPALHDAVDACVIKARPEQARVIACRKQAQAKGLTGDDRRHYARACRKGLALPDLPDMPANASPPAAPAPASNGAAQ